MQFKIPLDVQRPDRIVGPLTLRQLIIVAIGAGISYSLYLILSRQYVLSIWLIPIIFIMGITAAFAFYRYHDMNFEKVIFLFIEYYFKPRKRSFQKMKGDVLISVLQPLTKKPVSQSVKTMELGHRERLKKIQELTKLVDTKK